MTSRLRRKRQITARAAIGATLHSTLLALTLGSFAIATAHADDQTSGDWNDHDERAQPMVGRRNQRRREAAVKSDVGDDADETNEPLRDKTGDHGEDYGAKTDKENA